jgi:hypothetical protein
MQIVISVESVSWCSESIVLYGYPHPQLVPRQCHTGIINGDGTHLDNRLGDLWRRHDAKRREHPIGFLLAQLVHQERAQAAASAPTERVEELVSLERVAFFGLPAGVVLHA